MDVRLPNLGEGVDSGSVVTLFVKEGDLITKGQTLLELENEKAVAPIPSPAEGKVASIRVKPGDKISVGQVILSLASKDGEEPPAPAKPAAPASARPAADAAPPPPPQPEAGHAEMEEPAAAQPPSQRAGFPPPASPSLRRLAKDFGIDLNRVRGSQHGGRIVLADLRTYIQRLQQIASQQARQPQQRMPAAESVDFSQWGPVSAMPLSSLRQVISRRMLESWTTVPHVTQFDQADLTVVNELRKRYGQPYESKGVKLTVTAFVLKAVVAVLKKHPMFNASLDEASSQIVFKEYYHLGLAVDTEAGLLVPVIRDADSKSLLQISKDIQDLADRGRDRKLALDEMRGGTFTISNQGGIGSGHFTPIISKPEVAILGLGRASVQPVSRKDQIVSRLMMPLALSYDHRVIDGANAARFMVDLVAALESFSEAEVKP